MDNYICFLGQSQTFMGVLATIIVLSIRRNDSNFVFQILDDIKKYIVTRVKEIKPIISFDRVKDSSAYKAISLYSKTKDNGKDELINQCNEYCLLITLKKLEAQKKLTNWDKDAEQFAKSIYQNQEQQMAPMFIFAYCIIVFLYDELVRYPDRSMAQQLSYAFILFSLMVFVFWLTKWIIFLSMDDESINDKMQSQEAEESENSLKRIKSYNGIIKSIGCIIIEIFILLFIHEILIEYAEICFWVTFISPICISFLYTRISAGGNIEQTKGGVCLHYVCQFFMMLFLTFICIVELNIIGSDYFQLYDLCSKEWLFRTKVISFAIVICYGLIFPFLFPLIKYMWIYVEAFFKIQKFKTEVFCETNRLKKKFENLSKKIDINE